MDFLTNIYTVEERDRLLYEIELYKRQDFGNIRTTSLEGLKETPDLGDLSKTLKSFDVVTITLAVRPTMSIVETLFTVLKNSVSKPIIIDFLVQEDLIGGATFIYKGKYLDFSVLNQLTNGGL